MITSRDLDNMKSSPVKWIGAEVENSRWIVAKIAEVEVFD